MNSSYARLFLMGLIVTILWHLPGTVAESSPQKARVALGLRLFFDPRLSGDNRMSCGSCHIPELAYTDGRPRAIDRNGKTLRRNTSSLILSVNNKHQLWDGRVRTLEEQVLEPLRNTNEMNQNLDELVMELEGDPEYVRLFQEAFGSPIFLEGISVAIAAFERTIVPGKSPFDRFMAGEKSAISEGAQRGMDLFQKKAKCAFCHSGLDFTNRKFHNLGVFDLDPKNPDLGRFLVTGNPKDRGAFKTPTLRNIEQTAPYMHNGILKTLEEVVGFYNMGGRPNPHLDAEMVPLNLTPQEKKDLVAFMKSLTGKLPTIILPKFD